MKAMVTGGAGFLGRYLVKELVEKGIDTIIYDKNLSSATWIGDLPDSVITVSADILDLKTLSEAMDDCDIIFHTAAIADIEESRNEPIRTMQVNVIGTAICLEAARRAGVKRFLFASSVYTAGNRGSFYRVSKQAGESLCKTYYEDFGLEYTILKYGSLYGRDANHWNFMYTVCRALLQDGEYVYESSPEAIREYIHIADAARETVRIAFDADFINKTVLIAGHQRMKMKEFFETLKEIMRNKVTVTYVPDEQQCHYIRSPYSFDLDVPVRINLSQYIDIHEGILDCLNEVRKLLEEEGKDGED